MESNILKAKIVERGYTQGEVAKKLGISPNTLTTRMNGTKCFNTDEVSKLCEILEIRDDSEKCRIFLS